VGEVTCASYMIRRAALRCFGQFFAFDCGNDEFAMKIQHVGEEAYEDDADNFSNYFFHVFSPFYIF